ncbi:hypothetical protein AX13_01485 [Comamonas aquatica DA1877]|uniref:Uncharacterized protein n=1 Tax=Comamonas aquatica DA1877 TaxID=1457173 RepID=A0A014P1S8_9BURK|nr:hypothetical protein AX13_01485 [Comamonas aquatica DA1877]
MNRSTNALKTIAKILTTMSGDEDHTGFITQIGKAVAQRLLEVLVFLQFFLNPQQCINHRIASYMYGVFINAFTKQIFLRVLGRRKMNIGKHPC